MITSRIAMPALLVGTLFASGTEGVAQTFTFEQSFSATTCRLQMPSDARTRRAVTIAYEVQVPAGTRVMTHSESGATLIDTGSGAIEAEFRSDAAFTLDATSGSGSVQTQNLSVQGENDKRRVAGSLAGGGPVVQLTSRSGSITLRSAGS